MRVEVQCEWRCSVSGGAVREWRCSESGGAVRVEVQ